MRKFAMILAGCAVAGVAVGQALAPAKPEQAIKYRQSVMFVMGQHVGPLAAMVRGDRPFDQNVFVQHATMVETMAKLPFDAFYVAGADQGKHGSKPEVFKEKDKFMSGATRLQDAAAKLVAAGKSGDQAAIKTAFGALGGSCKNCHEPYRVQ